MRTIKNEGYPDIRVDGIGEYCTQISQTIDGDFGQILIHPSSLPKLRSVIEEIIGDGWVSVEERMPEEGEPCLVYGSVRHGDIMVHIGAFEYGRWDSDGDAIRNVTHWRPIPSPPKKEVIK